MTEGVFDQSFWDERYRSSSKIWSGDPNPQLVAEVAGLAPGRALDIGCGEGADALWLARHGWDVVAADISTVALERAASHAQDVDPRAAARIEWRHADLVNDPPEPGAFDLVSAQFMQLPPTPRRKLFEGAVRAVRIGGTLLVVGHDPSDMTSGAHRPHVPEVFYTAEEVAEMLDSSWTVLVSEARARAARGADGGTVTVHDAVLRAELRPRRAPS